MKDNMVYSENNELDPRSDLKEILIIILILTCDQIYNAIGKKRGDYLDIQVFIVESKNISSTDFGVLSYHVGVLFPLVELYKKYIEDDEAAMNYYKVIEDVRTYFDFCSKLTEKNNK